jgi:hypothetical protein
MAKFRFSTRALLSVTFLVAAALAAVVALRRAAEREYASYDALKSLGAMGDDWVSFLELVTGRPPIVELYLPQTVPPDQAFRLLPDLRNLEGLILDYSTLSEAQLEIIRDLRLHSLRFVGDFPTDADVDRLSGFRGIQFIYVPTSNLSSDAKKRLQTLLPSTLVEFD